MNEASKETEASIEDQAERAVRAYYPDAGPAARTYAYQSSTRTVRPLFDVMCSLLRGEFKEEPLPEIEKPEWAAHCAVSYRAINKKDHCVWPGSSLNVTWPPPTEFRVFAWSDEDKDTGLAYGPWAPTKREAILAFNKRFGKRA